MIVKKFCAVASEPSNLYTEGTVKICKGDCMAGMLLVSDS